MTSPVSGVFPAGDWRNKKVTVILQVRFAAAVTASQQVRVKLPRLCQSGADRADVHAETKGLTTRWPFFRFVIRFFVFLFVFSFFLLLFTNAVAIW